MLFQLLSARRDGASHSLFVSAVIVETKLKVAEIILYLISLLPELTIFCSAPRFSYHIQFIHNSLAQHTDSRRHVDEILE